jgi:hypothetical protein
VTAAAAAYNVAFDILGEYSHDTSSFT